MLNKIVLMGRLTKDPELRYTATNVPVCSFSIAVGRAFAKAGEQKQTDFFNVIAWRNTAEFVQKYFTKGMLVVVTGRLENRTWDDQEGKRHYATEIISDEVHFTGEKRDNANVVAGNSYSGQPQGNDSGFTTVDSDDDLPF